MARTCLQIVQTACARIGLLQPNAVLTSSDQQVQQLLALANQEGAALAKRYPWQSLRAESTFTTLAAQLQGTLSSLAPGMKYIVNDTIWNRTKRIPIIGSKSPQDWQEMVSMSLTSPYSQYRVMGDSLYMYPVPTAGESCAFEYVSKNWVSLYAGSTGSVFANDSDTTLVDDDLMVEGIVWRWKAAKGLDYAEDFATYENSIADAMARDASKPTLNSNGIQYGVRPAVVVPVGSWPL